MLSWVLSCAVMHAHWWSVLVVLPPSVCTVLTTRGVLATTLFGKPAAEKREESAESDSTGRWLLLACLLGWVGVTCSDRLSTVGQTSYVVRPYA